MEKRYDHDSFILGTALLYTLRSIRHNIVGSLVSTVILKGLALLPDASFGIFFGIHYNILGLKEHIII